jgi:hypothetical protein
MARGRVIGVRVDVFLLDRCGSAHSIEVDLKRAGANTGPFLCDVGHACCAPVAVVPSTSPGK